MAYRSTLANFRLFGGDKLACEKAGIKPEFVTYGGDDADGYALSVNINRRHLSKGQRAMAVAKVYPEPAKGGRGSIIEPDTVHKGSLSQARTVLRLAPELAGDVLAGDVSLTDAYQKAGSLDGTANKAGELLKARDKAKGGETHGIDEAAEIARMARGATQGARDGRRG